MEDQMDNVDTEVAPQDDTQEEQVDSAEQESNSPEEEQSAEDQEEKTYAGKFKAVEDLEKSYINLESKLGNYKEVEEKARAFDQLSTQQRASGAPKWQDFVGQDGTLDAPAYEQAMLSYHQMASAEISRRAAREEVDLERVEREFPYIKDDPDAAAAVASVYQSGRARTLYEAAQKIDKMRRQSSGQGEKVGAQKKEKELAQKTRSFSERAGAKSNEGVTPEVFSKLTLEQKREYINKNF